MRHAYPGLRHYCREKYNVEFEVVDVKWGLSESELDRDDVMQLGLQHLRECLDTSLGPSFVVSDYIRTMLQPSSNSC